MQGLGFHPQHQRPAARHIDLKRRLTWVQADESLLQLALRLIPHPTFSQGRLRRRREAHPSAHIAFGG